ncbi:CMD domain protein [Pseudomonas cichorii]|uniref:CMD domain-containing protein n=1 Tax=Pseudomonas cichorii TaxID=36746 RepID=UPI0018E5CF1E|nr:CMD domain protein [Pseudomonas cichorii]MBI6856114.1 CMD domain protein [Pseudomonas cichorii]
MTSTVEPGLDVLDTLLGIGPETALYKVRHARDKVVAATQGSHELFFDPALQDNLSLVERLLVAYYASHLTPNALLAGYYLEQLQALNVEPERVAAIDSGAIEALSDARLSAILVFTRTLIESPVEGDRAALQVLQAAGLSSSEIVVLAQLIAFLSYQVRLAAGLGALSALGEAQ